MGPLGFQEAPCCRSHCPGSASILQCPPHRHTEQGRWEDTVGGCCLEKARVSMHAKGLDWKCSCPLVKQCFCKVSLHLCSISLQDSTHPPRLSEAALLGRLPPSCTKASCFLLIQDPFSTFEITLSKLPLGYIWVVRMMVSQPSKRAMS